MGAGEKLFRNVFGSSAKAKVISFLLSSNNTHGKADIAAATNISPKALESCLRELTTLGILTEEDRKFRINVKSGVGRALHVFYQELLLAKAEVS